MLMFMERNITSSSDSSESPDSPKALAFRDPRTTIMPDGNNEYIWASLKARTPEAQSPGYFEGQYGDNLLISLETDPLNNDDLGIRYVDNIPLFNKYRRMTDSSDDGPLNCNNTMTTGSGFYDVYAPEIDQLFSDNNNNNNIITSSYSYDMDPMADSQELDSLSCSVPNSLPSSLDFLACSDSSTPRQECCSNTIISMMVSIGGAILDFSVPILQPTMKGRHISEFLNPDEIDIFFSIMKGVLNSYKAENFRHCLRLPDGAGCREVLSVVTAVPSNRTMPLSSPSKPIIDSFFSPEGCFTVFVQSAFISPCFRCHSGRLPLSRPSGRYSVPLMRGINEQDEVGQWQSKLLSLEGTSKGQDPIGKSSSIRSSKGKKQRRPRSKKNTEDPRCVDCGALNSPEWRRGPSGLKTLCNACGLRWSKREKKKLLGLESRRASSTAGSNAIFTPTESGRSDDATDSDKSVDRSIRGSTSSTGFELDSLFGFSPYTTID